MYILLDVPGRSGIRIHSGNVAGRVDLGLKSDFAGCIAFGDRNMKMYGQLAVGNTVATIRRIEKYLNLKDFLLTITGDF